MQQNSTGHRSSPMTDKALLFLSEYVSRCEERAEDRLPTMAELASTAGVSQVTMRKAVGALREQGILTVSQKRGIHLARSNREAGATVPQARPARWREVAEALESDIAAGRFEAGVPLPTTRDLCVQYGASSRTVGRALRHVRDRRWLEPYGRTFRPVAVVPGTTGTLVAVGPDSDQWALSVERECSRRAVATRIIRYTDLHSGAIANSDMRFLGAATEETVVGFVVWPAADNVRDLLGTMHKCGRPVAVLDWGGETVGSLEGSTGLVDLFPVGAGERCGYRVGQYAVSRGHRSMVYVSPNGNAQWSRARLAGLRSSVEDLSVGGAVHACLSDSPAEPGRQVAALCSQAMEMTDATVWVAENDAVAVACKQFLLSRAKAVPEDLSLVSFGDTLSAFSERISSYDFDEHAILHRMLDCVLMPARQEAHQVNHGEIDGFVTERGSVARLG